MTSSDSVRCENLSNKE
ncbi:unnamed protein product, partial [Adineta ricciae]